MNRTWTLGRRLVLAVSFLVAVASMPSGSGLDPTSRPPPQATLAAVGKRLSRSLPPGELTRLAARGDRVLKVLEPEERSALAHGGLRFRVDRPTVVSVAAPRDSVPFWVEDLGFRRTGFVLNDAEVAWSVFEKTVGPGRVTLGVNGLDRTPQAHYVVLLRTPDGRPVVPEDVSSDAGGWRVLPADEGVSLASGVDRPITTLTPELRGATLLQPEHDQRHATLLAKGRVWKTHVPATRRPDQVTVSFGAEASAELVWSWRTASDAGPSVLRYSRADGTGPAVSVSAASRTLETPDVLNDPEVQLHSARVTGLTAATEYAYTLGDGTPAGTSPRAAVRTGPSRSSDAHLIYMGDPQCGLERWGRLLADARRRHPEAGALLIAGDLVDRGNERTNWDHFFLRAAGVFEGLPVMPAVGNHEYLDRGPWLYRSFFHPPENGPAGTDSGLVYAFEYGDVFVAVLDSTRAVFSPKEADRQSRWLDDRLGRTTARWKLVMFHHPVYASHTWRENPSLRDAWAPVLDRHRVDFVLQGHDHAYMRTYPMAGGRRSAGGTVYVVAVSGDKYCEQDARGVAEVGFTNVSTYQTIDADHSAGRLLYRAWDAAGREVDRVEVVKRAGEGSASAGIAEVSGPMDDSGLLNAPSTITAIAPPRSASRRP